jgi:hypothetical protein
MVPLRYHCSHSTGVDRHLSYQSSADEHTVEIVAQMALDLLTDYINVPVGFPAVTLRRGA